MNNLNNSISIQDNQKTCKAATKALKLINSNYQSLINIEPSYSWEEIKGALVDSQINSCEI
tara:strand:+ start:193 stop:375 length:183 start_codon:yes stop_codon:yes gene_type:complete